MLLGNLVEKFSDRGAKRYRSSIFLSLVLFYFAFHLVTGERGLLAYVKLKGEIENKKHELSQIQEEKERLANKVVNIRDESLDLDLLEEVARKDLGYAKEDEIIYFWE